MSVVENFDPWADTDGTKQQKIHFRVKKRSKRKCITKIEGLPTNFNFKKICKVIRKKFSCCASVQDDDMIEGGKILVLSGDQRESIKNWMVEEGMAEEEAIIIHGF